MSSVLLKSYAGDEPYVFFSYSHENADKGREIIAQLQVMGVRVWYDHGIRAGDDWRSVLRKKLENCGVFIALLSREYYGSKYCFTELSDAFDARLPIIPIRIDSVDPDWDIAAQTHFSQGFVEYYKGNMRNETFYSELLKGEGMRRCTGKPIRESEINLETAIDVGNHAVLAVDIMQGLNRYEDDLCDVFCTAIRSQEEFGPVRRYIFEAASLLTEGSKKLLQFGSTEVWYKGGRCFSIVVKKTPIPENDPEARQQYVRDFCDALNVTRDTLMHYGITDIHIAYRGAYAVAGFLGQALGHSFRVFYYQLRRNGATPDKANEYYCIGAESIIESAK